MGMVVKSSTQTFFKKKVSIELRLFLIFSLVNKLMTGGLETLSEETIEIKIDNGHLYAHSNFP